MAGRTRKLEDGNRLGINLTNRQEPWEGAGSRNLLQEKTLGAIRPLYAPVHPSSSQFITLHPSSSQFKADNEPSGFSDSPSHRCCPKSLDTRVGSVSFPLAFQGVPTCSKVWGGPETFSCHQRQQELGGGGRRATSVTSAGPPVHPSSSQVKASNEPSELSNSLIQLCCPKSWGSRTWECSSWIFLHPGQFSDAANSVKLIPELSSPFFEIPFSQIFLSVGPLRYLLFLIKLILFSPRKGKKKSHEKTSKHHKKKSRLHQRSTKKHPKNNQKHQ